jgi:hypothetical protein
MMATEIRLAHWQGIKLDYLIVLNYSKGLVAQNITNLFLGLWVVCSTNYATMDGH